MMMNIFLHTFQMILRFKKNLVEIFCNKMINFFLAKLLLIFLESPETHFDLFTTKSEKNSVVWSFMVIFWSNF